jgi:hypothetical protein
MARKVRRPRPEVALAKTAVRGMEEGARAVLCARTRERGGIVVEVEGWNNDTVVQCWKILCCTCTVRGSI